VAMGSANERRNNKMTGALFTLPKGEASCWRAAIRSPSFSFRA
jgi:hypothetical protein